MSGHHGKGHSPTTYGGVFAHKVKHFANEGLSRGGFYGLQFLVDAMNPYLWLNIALGSRTEAKRNREIEKYNRSHTAKRGHDNISGIMGSSPGMREFVSRSNAQMVRAGMEIARLEQAMERRIDSISKDRKSGIDSRDALEKFGIKAERRLGEKEILVVLEFFREEKRLMAEFRHAAIGYTTAKSAEKMNFYAEKLEGLRKGIDAQNKRLRGPQGAIIAMGLMEASAITNWKEPNTAAELSALKKAVDELKAR